MPLLKTVNQLRHLDQVFPSISVELSTLYESHFGDMSNPSFFAERVSWNLCRF